jgi:hypothetical protein
MDNSRRGVQIVVTGIGAARLWCENEHAVWVTFDGRRPVGYRRDQVRTPEDEPLPWPPVI